jgi:hypothetical protein
MNAASRDEPIMRLHNRGYIVANRKWDSIAHTWPTLT